jgi:hypothetical protein
MDLGDTPKIFFQSAGKRIDVLGGMALAMRGSARH